MGTLERSNVEASGSRKITFGSQPVRLLELENASSRIRSKTLLSLAVLRCSFYTSPDKSCPHFVQEPPFYTICIFALDERLNFTTIDRFNYESTNFKYIHVIS